MVKAILFDIDGVLVDSVKANAHLYRDVLGHFGLTGPTDEEQRTNNHRTFIDNIRHYARTTDEALIQRMFEYGMSFPREYDLMELTDGVQDTLKALQKRYALGVVSSRLHRGLGHLLEFFGLDGYFSVQVGFEDTAEHKPHPDPLLFGARKLGYQPSDVVYVGDVETDVQAARSAGMRMVHYATETLPGDHTTVRDFRALLDAVSML